MDGEPGHRSGGAVEGRTKLHSRFGALIVDLSEAVLPGREIEVEASAFCGKVIITVPENARILDEGGALFGKRSVTSGRHDGDEDGPLIRITGRAGFGKVMVYRRGEGSEFVNTLIDRYSRYVR